MIAVTQDLLIICSLFSIQWMNSKEQLHTYNITVLSCFHNVNDDPCRLNSIITLISIYTYTINEHEMREKKELKRRAHFYSLSS